MKHTIKNRWNGNTIFEGEFKSLALCVSKAIESGADLSSANLSSADLSGTNLSVANLSSADLSGTNLSVANLSSANLSSANLSRANLSRANLSRANLSRANLSRANLSRANLFRANLFGADLSCADLSGADLSGAKNATTAIAMTRILPEGKLIGWKKCKNNVIVKLCIPEAAKRSHAFSRKCRAEYIKVLEVIGDKAGISQHDGKTEYRKGKIVKCDNWCDDYTQECAGGIHFFITREEAENYSN